LSKLAWLTADSLPSAWIDYRFRLPDDDAWRAQVRGALVALMYSENFEPFGTLTPEQMADTWGDIVLEFFNEVQFMVPTGTILEFAGSNLPEGFLWADGSVVSRTTYANLFAAVGDRFGPGDGSTTFQLPDRRGRVAVGADEEISIFESVGATGGEIYHTLTLAEMPVHDHNALYGTGAGGSSARYAPSSGTGGSNASIVENAGSGQAHQNMPPYLVENFIIKF